MTTSSRKPTDGHTDDIEQLVHDYLRRSGKLIPQTGEEVEAAEKWLSQQAIQVPKSLQSLDGCSLNKRRVSPKVLPFPIQSTEIGECLARAAREGKTIAPEVEQQMKRDREQKEREAKGDK